LQQGSKPWQAGSRKRREMKSKKKEEKKRKEKKRKEKKKNDSTGPAH
jgi:hypothetical protein